MKKKLMMAAVAAALAGPTLAYAAAEVYGLLDIGIQNVKPGAGYAGTKNFINDAQGSGGTRLGFRGTDDIGGGLKGVFVFELGVRPDTGSLDNSATAAPSAAAPLQLFQRQIYGGLTSDWGTATLGRHYSEEFLVAASGDYNVAAAVISPYGLESKTTRISNSVKYTSPSLGGVVVIAGTFGVGAQGAAPTFAAGSEGTTAATADDGKYTDLAAKATFGPVKVGLALSKMTIATTPKTEKKDQTLGGNWNFGIGTLYFIYTTDKIDASGTTVADQNLLSLGAAFRLGNGDLVVELARVDDKTAANNDAKLMALAYYYNLSKATTVYASYGRLNNNTTGTRSMTGQAVATTAAGEDPKALVLGWRIAF